MTGLCIHLYVIDKSFGFDLLEKKKKHHCDWCQVGDNDLWLCLFTGCLKVGCGEANSNHSFLHNTHIPAHCITINLNNRRAWCYICELEVTNMIINTQSLYDSQCHLGGQIQALSIPLAQPIASQESSGDDEIEDDNFSVDDEFKPKGLVGLRNLGLTCYMNAALQALSNSIPLCQFLRDCPSFLQTDRSKPNGVVQPFHRLVCEMWHPKRPNFIAPVLLYRTFRTLYPMFRPYTQQDSQEFLRYFMDQLHEELRQPVVQLIEEEDSDNESNSSTADTETFSEFASPLTVSDDSSQSGDDYETCDSGMSDRSRHSICSNRSNLSLKTKNKRKRRHHFNSIGNPVKWMATGFDHEQSEFSDAMSDTSLIRGKQEKSQLNRDLTNSTSSGIGSSKPSLSSFRSVKPSSPLNMDSKHQNLTMGKRSSPNQTLKLSSSIQKNKKQPRYRSIISDSFDGVLVSSVQCLTCNNISSKKETFQDLSLPIPSSDQINLLHQHGNALHLHGQQSHLPSGIKKSLNVYMPRNTCNVSGDGWLLVWLWVWVASVLSWVRSWLWGPSVSLLRCLAAFFSADELKGDNMYCCGKCGKLRNGIKYSKVIQLPEVLIIHLKRFRHEYMYSSKIGQYVSFPLTGLDLSPFLHKDCSSEVRTYDLYSVICHHGAVNGGHYTAYSMNGGNGKWYEFDDQCVTQVCPETVASCEAYVLFYKKMSPEMASKRQRTIELMQVSLREPSLMQFFISKQWLNKFNTFAEPGPIDNSDFLCPHGGVQPLKSSFVCDLVLLLNLGVWEYLHQTFGGGPACNRLYECITCREELDSLLHRQTEEYEKFIKLHNCFQRKEHPSVIYAISMKWFRNWECFVRGRQLEIPTKIDNSSISVSKHGVPHLKPGSDYAQISKETWMYFYNIYGGGPELFVVCGSHDSEDSGEEQENDREYLNQEEFGCSETSGFEELARRDCCASTEKKCFPHCKYVISRSKSSESLDVRLEERRSIGYVRQRTVSDSEVQQGSLLPFFNSSRSLNASSSKRTDLGLSGGIFVEKSFFELDGSLTLAKDES